MQLQASQHPRNLTAEMARVSSAIFCASTTLNEEMFSQMSWIPSVSFTSKLGGDNVSTEKSAEKKAFAVCDITRTHLPTSVQVNSTSSDSSIYFPASISPALSSNQSQSPSHNGQ